MIAAPAVDLRGGRCVQLVGGRPEDERVSLPDPVAVARSWRDLGFATLHVVDLDGALDQGNNRDLVARIASDVPGDLQVGGGIRTDDLADELVAAGVNRIIVGTRAVDDIGWLEAVTDRHPRRVIVAADIRNGRVLRRGWAETSDLDIEGFLKSLSRLPLAGVLCTDVVREGQVQGIDRAEVSRVLSAGKHPVWISGGVSTLDELRFLDEQGAAGAVLGMALYTGSLDAQTLAREFGR